MRKTLHASPPRPIRALPGPRAAWLAFCLGLAACSGQQSDWQKARETNTPEAYGQFLKRYPSGEFSGQAQARLKELEEERDWQKARDLDTTESYQAFLHQYPDGKWSEEARIRVENFTLAQPPSGPGAASAATGPAGAAAPPAAASAAAGAGASRPPAASAKTASLAVAAAPSRPPSTTASTAESRPESAGGYGVQLGAFKSGAGAAHRHWSRLSTQYPALFKGLRPKVAAASTAAGPVHRLQATGLSAARARAICKALEAHAQACVVIPPAPR